MFPEDCCDLDNKICSSSVGCGMTNKITAHSRNPKDRHYKVPWHKLTSLQNFTTQLQLIMVCVTSFSCGQYWPQKVHSWVNTRKNTGLSIPLFRFWDSYCEERSKTKMPKMSTWLWQLEAQQNNFLYKFWRVEIMGYCLECSQIKRGVLGIRRYASNNLHYKL